MENRKNKPGNQKLKKSVLKELKKARKEPLSSYIDHKEVLKEFEELTKFGTKFAGKKGVKNEEDVIERIHEGRGVLETDKVPSMKEMFKQRSKLKQKRKYTTKEIIKISHELREKR